MNPIRSARASEFTTTIPPIMSLWPFRYFVVEWSTTSAPSSSGRWKHGVARGESRGEGEAVAAAFQRRDVTLERLARRVAGARVLVTFVFPEALLDVGRRLIDRHHDGAREGVGYLSGVHRARGEPPNQVIPRYLGHGGNVRAPFAPSKRPLR